MLKEKPSLEGRKRVEGILKKLNDIEEMKQPLPPDEIRAIRAVEALEAIGNAEARKLLDTYAKGAPGARLTEEARKTVQRLKSKLPLP